MEKFLEEITKKKVDEVQIIGRGEYKISSKLVRFNRWEDKREIMAKRKEIERARRIFMDDGNREINTKMSMEYSKSRERKGEESNGSKEYG